MRNSLVRILFCACSFFMFSNGVAPAEGVNLEQIVVTASRYEDDAGELSRNLDVITASEIAGAGYQNTAEALAGITSVNISDYGGIGAVKNVRMRGSSSGQVLVMVDGRPVNSPRDGEADLSSIPLDNIEKIEVLHGPGSSLYGAGAMGGIVNIITKSPPKGKAETELYSAFGTFRTYTERFSHGAGLGGFSYLLSGGYLDSEGARTNSAFNSRDLNAKLQYELNDSNMLSLNTGVYRGRLGAPGTSGSEDNDDRQNDVKNFWDLGWKFKPDDNSGISARVYQNYERLSFLENSAGAYYETAGAKDAHTTRTVGTDIQYDRQITDIYRALCGFNYASNSNDSTASGNHEYYLRAFYLENKLDLGEKIRLDLGARVDDYSNFGSEISPSAGMHYALREDLKLRACVSRSFRAPTFNDLYWPDQGYIKGNSALSPEKGVTKEIGIDKQFTKRFSSGITFYRSDYRDLINWVDDAGVYQPKNVGSARIDGVEFANRLKFGDSCGLNLAYTFLRAKDKDTGKYLVYQPKDKVDITLYSRDLKGFDCELQGHFTGSRFYDQANSVSLRRFVTCDFSVSRKFSETLTAFIVIKNIFNAEYQIIRDYPMPGFSLTGGVKMKF